MEILSEQSEIDAIIADIGSQIATSSCIYIESLLSENKKLKADRKSLKSKLKTSSHIFQKAKGEIENIKFEIENYKKRGIFQSQCLNIEKTKNKMTDFAMKELTEDYERLMEEHELLKERILKHSNRDNVKCDNHHSPNKSNVDQQEKGNQSKERRGLTSSISFETYGVIEKGKSINSATSEPSEVEDAVTEYFEASCNSSVAKLESYMTILQKSLKKDIESVENEDNDENEFEYLPNLAKGGLEVLYHHSKINVETNADNQEMRNQTVTRKLIDNKHNSENAEIVEVIADISSQLAASSCNVIEKIMEGKSKLKNKYKSLLSKTKRIKYDFQRAKQEITDIQREFDLHKKRDVFASTLSDIDITKSRLVNLKLAVALDDTIEKNQFLKSDITAANQTIESIREENEFLTKANEKEINKWDDHVQELHASDRYLNDSFENISFLKERHNSLSLENYDIKQSSMSNLSFTLICNTSMKELDLIFSDIDHELETIDADYDENDYSITNDILLEHSFSVQNKVECNDLDDMNKINMNNKTCPNIHSNIGQNLSTSVDALENDEIEKIATDISIKLSFACCNLIGNSFCKNEAPKAELLPSYQPHINNTVNVKEHGCRDISHSASVSNLSDLLERIELEEITAQVSSIFLASSCGIIEKAVRENRKHKAKHKILISKAKSIKHDFGKAKLELENMENELHLMKKRDEFDSKLNDLDNTKNDMDMIKMELLLDDVIEENNNLKQAVLVHEELNESKDDAGTESKKDSEVLIIKSPKSKIDSQSQEHKSIGSVDMVDYKDIKNMNNTTMPPCEQTQSILDISQLIIEPMSAMIDLDSMLLDFEREIGADEESDDILYHNNINEVFYSSSCNHNCNINEAEISDLLELIEIERVAADTLSKLLTDSCKFVAETSIENITTTSEITFTCNNEVNLFKIMNEKIF